MSVPSHLAIIPDGNRRFAKKEGKLGYEGHNAGVENFKKVLSWCKEVGIKEVSFWALSTENLKRDSVELKALFKILSDACESILKKKEKELTEIKIRFLGNLSLLPKDLQEKMRRVEEFTKKEPVYSLNILIAYGGRQEILQAVQEIAQDVSKGKIKPSAITDDLISSRLYLSSEPDLIIRTGHACLSGFLPWQSAYSEIMFLEGKLWPEFTRKDFDGCIEEFSNRRRSFGK